FFAKAAIAVCVYIIVIAGYYGSFFVYCFYYVSYIAFMVFSCFFVRYVASGALGFWRLSGLIFSFSTGTILPSSVISVCSFSTRCNS
ncbi:hypothetical protein PQ744_13260, partial [Thermoanaerobacterium thermosaccharolyticum]|uniref:hypothetical protein n=1 Tax=Thermoanaerobacterium thermosaccharolyticum TaxID=1517 RepID=UPI003D28EBD1